jgi:hypothetical protein
VLPASCADCEADPAQRDYWNCDGKPEQLAWKDEISGDEFYLCPLRTIPGNVFEWYDEYVFHKRFPGSGLRYDRITPKWIEAVSVYEAALREFQTIHAGKGVANG